MVLIQLARLSALAAIVNHFQQLFDVPSVGGVYPTMSRVYQLVQESSTAYKQLVTILMAGPGLGYMFQTGLRNRNLRERENEIETKKERGERKKETKRGD